MKKSENGENKRTSISQPSAASPSDVAVVQMPPGMTTGNLCTAFGDATFPSGVSIMGVYAVVKLGNGQTATDQELLNGKNCPMSGDGRWSFPSTSNPSNFLTANTGPNNGDEADNTIIAASVYVNYVGGTPTPTFSRQTVNFKGKKVTACTSPMSKVELGSATTPKSHEAHPVDVDNG